MSFKGKLNIYVCNKCRGHVVTKDVDQGVTPFMMQCRAEEGCKGDMESSMYRVYDQSMRPDYEWYMPTEHKGLSAGTIEHIKMGGLILRTAPCPYCQGNGCSYCGQTGNDWGVATRRERLRGA